MKYHNRKKLFKENLFLYFEYLSIKKSKKSYIHKIYFQPDLILKLIEKNYIKFDKFYHNNYSIIMSFSILKRTARDDHIDLFFNKILKIKKHYINLKNNQGNTALFYACINGNKKAVEYLLAHPNIDIHIQNNRGKTALDAIREINLNHPTNPEDKKHIENMLVSFEEKKEFISGTRINKSSKKRNVL